MRAHAAVRLIWGGAILVGLASSPVLAQNPAGGAQPPGGAASGFTGSATVAFSFESGRTDLSATQMSFQGRRPYSEGGALTMSASWRHATTQPPGEEEHLTVANQIAANVGIEHDYGDRWVLMIRSQAMRDTISRIDYRFEQIAGFGVRMQNARVQTRIIPGIALLNHDKNVPLENGFNINYGVYQDLRVALTPAWTLTQFIYASRDVSDDNDYTVSFDASLTGAITRRLGLQVSFQHQYESLLPAGVEPEYQKLMVGLQITL